MTRNIGGTLTDLFRRATREGIPTGAMADRMALEVLGKAAQTLAA